jgi:hypothetical protein
MSRRALASFVLAICLGCGASAEQLLRESRGLQALAQQASEKDRACTAAAPVGAALAAPAPAGGCASLLLCIDATQRAVHACDDALQAQSRGDRIPEFERACFAEGRAADRICLEAGVPRKRGR